MEYKYVNIPELLISHSKLNAYEVMLYCRALHFYKCQKAKNQAYYIDQLETAKFLQVSRRSVTSYIKTLTALGLLIPTGSTISKNITYIVVEWQNVPTAFHTEEEHAELVAGYEADRVKRSAQLQAHHEKKAAEATEEVSTSFKQNTTQATPEPQEAPQERVEPQPIQSQPEPEKEPQRVIESVSDDAIEIIVYQAADIFGALGKAGYKNKSFDIGNKIMAELKKSNIATYDNLIFRKAA